MVSESKTVRPVTMAEFFSRCGYPDRRQSVE